MSATLLKNGLIVDGSGAEPFHGTLLMRNGKIDAISRAEISADANEIDCSGRVISPGWIDTHSHMDWFLRNPDPAFHLPFPGQGITTFVGGMCGYGIAGYRQNSPYRKEITNNLFYGGATGTIREKLSDYYDDLEQDGIYCNTVNFIGHGTTRASLRGFRPGELDPAETEEMLSLVDEAIDHGARGVSFGLTYEPGIFTSNREIETIAELLAKRGKMMTVHGRAYSALAPTYPLVPFGRPHNLRAIDDMVLIAKKTGVKMNYSHLIFAGTKTWKTVDRALELFERAREAGIDLMTEIFAQTGGPTQINSLFPDWFLAKGKPAYRNGAAIARLRVEIKLITRLLGFGFDNVVLTFGDHPDLNPFNGMTIRQMADQKRVDPFFALLEISEKSEGRARIFNTNYLNEAILEKLLPHPAVLFMTDAWYEPEGIQNPALYGTFPGILAMIRDRKLLPMEEAIRKMTGAAAERYAIPKRGLLKEGYHADVTVFDYEKLKDNTTIHNPIASPSGIEHVFVNGGHLNDRGTLDRSMKAGMVIR